MRVWWRTFILVALMTGFCSARPALVEVARSRQQWTGVAVSHGGRIFVNYPRWSDHVPISVAELGTDGQPHPYPDAEWNHWDKSLSPSDHFVCVQSVYVDARDHLWILDPASPKIAGVVQGGPKLLEVDLHTNQVLRVLQFDTHIAPKKSYLNDVRVDTARNFAYLTDSGIGGLVVVDLKTEAVWRVLQNDPATHDEGFAITAHGKTWRRPDGQIAKGQSDGIALDPAGHYLYWMALTGRHLYRIDTAWLRHPAAGLAAHVERLGTAMVADGLLFGPDGHLYLTQVENDGLGRWDAGRGEQTLVRDNRLLWPDSLAASGGWLYVTASQVMNGPHPTGPYRLFKMKLPN